MNVPEPKKFVPGRRLKQALDYLASGMALLVLAPFFALVALAIKLDSPGAVFFRQERAGLEGKPFRIFKFRSMVPGAENSGAISGDADPRITRLGRRLRLTSVDELPQLINVLKGEMSLVGPRPLLKQSIRVQEKGRLEMKPGLTGLATIYDNEALTWEQRMALDIWYVDHWSFVLDLWLLVKTVPVALGRRQLYDPQREGA